MRGNLFLVFVFLIGFCACRPDPLKELPKFNLLLSDSLTIFNTANIPMGKTIVMIHFDSECGDCQRETDSLLQNIDQLRDVQIYFLSVEKMENVRLWEDYFHLKKYPNILVGQDTKQAFAKHFQSRSTPLLAIYDKKKILVGVYEGSANIKDLIASIKKV